MQQEEKDLLILQKNTPEKQRELRYNELARRGIPEPELSRAVNAEFIDYPTPTAVEPWPGPVTGVDLAGNINLDIVPDTGFPPVIQPNTDKTEPFPTPNKSPYGIGTTEQPYPSSPSPSSPNVNPNATNRPLGSVSDMYSVTNFPAEPSDNWSATASQLDSEPSMHNEEGYNSHMNIPPWNYDIEDSQMVDISIPPIAIEPSGQFNEAVMPEKNKKKEKKSILARLAPWLLFLGASFPVQRFVNDYVNSVYEEPKPTIDKSMVKEPRKVQIKAKDYLPKSLQNDKKVIHASKSIDQYLKDAPKEPEKRNYYFTYNLPKIMAKFTLSSRHKGKDVCDDYAGKVFDLLDLERPILPSEGKGYVNLTHPHCQCYWQIVKDSTADSLTRKQKTSFDDIAQHIEKAAKDHTLHTVKPDGELSSRTRGTNPMKESIGKIRHESAWLTDEYLGRAKEAAIRNGGQLYLIRAATQTITDHRAEGEQYRRKLSGKELNGMARTAIGTNMDINHNKDYATGGEILDSEYDQKRKEIQMLVMETDPQIIQSIENGDITAVSINGGNPRRQTIEPCYDGCDGPECELCNAPEGVILGELDGIGMTWVVTVNNGIMWRGQHIPQATPGIKSTVLEIL